KLLSQLLVVLSVSISIGLTLIVLNTSPCQEKSHNILRHAAGLDMVMEVQRL
ncbi:hypothetical protein COCCADRAFT_97104, partial [Bipolaris zeicola 26-R-13]